MATLTSILTDIASAIREKKESTEKLKPVNFANEILSIKTGGAVASGDEITAQASENINVGNSVVIKETGALPSYTPKYYIPTSVQIGSTTETPTVQGHKTSDLSFRPSAQTMCLGDKLVSVKYTTGNMLLFVKKDEEYKQLKIDNEYKYLTTTQFLYVDYDRQTNKVFVLDIDSTNLFNINVYNLDETNETITFETKITEDYGVTSTLNLNSTVMFASRGHIFIGNYSVGLKYAKYDINSKSFGTWKTSSPKDPGPMTIVVPFDFVEKGDTDLYISFGVRGLIHKYQISNGEYSLVAQSAGNITANIQTATINKDATAIITGNSTTRSYFNITESGSTISLTAGTMPTNLTGDTFCFMKDSNDILRFGSSSIAGNTAIYRLKDGAATLVTTPGTDFVPHVTTGSYGAYIFGRQASTVSSHILCQLSSGGLCIFVPSYETAPFSITKANNKLSTSSDVYALGFSLEDITAGNNGQVIASFIK